MHRWLKCSVMFHLRLLITDAHTTIDHLRRNRIEAAALVECACNIWMASWSKSVPTVAMELRLHLVRMTDRLLATGTLW